MNQRECEWGDCEDVIKDGIPGEYDLCRSHREKRENALEKAKQIIGVQDAPGGPRKIVEAHVEDHGFYIETGEKGLYDAECREILQETSMYIAATTATGENLVHWFTPIQHHISTDETALQVEENSSDETNDSEADN